MRPALLLLLLFVVPVSARAGEEVDALVDRLVDRLASPSYAEREDAYRELEELGPRAAPRLREHRDAEDPEVARLVERLLRELAAKDGEEIVRSLSLRNNEFTDSEAFRRIVARGRAVLPEIWRVLDEEDATWPNYDYWRMKNAYEVLSELLTEDDLPTLLARLDHPNPQQRYLLAPLLQRMDRAVVLPALLRLIGDADAPARARAHAIEMTRDTGLTGSDERIPPLVRRLLSAEEPLVRAAAVSWFAYRRDEGVLDRLVAATRDDHREVRLAAVRALRNYRGEAVREALEVVLRDPDGEIRAAAIEAIRNSAGPGLAPRLRPFLKDPDPVVRSSAAQTLAQMGDKAALPTLVGLLDERNEEFLTRALHSVLTAVRRLGDEAAVPALRKLLEDSRSHSRIANYRYLILAAMLELGGEKTFPEVREWITGSEVQNRHVVLDALAGIDAPGVTDILLTALETGTTPEKNSAVRALLARDHRAAAPAILAALEREKDSWFLSEAVKALHAFDHEAAVPAMTELLALDPDDGRNTALFYSLFRALAWFRASGAAPRIAELAGASRNLRGLGIEALAGLGNAEVVPALEKLASEDPNLSGRTRTAIALARLGEGGPLREILESGALDSAPVDRAGALLALGREEEAKEILDRTEREAGGNGRTLWNLGCLYARLGDLDRAFALLDEGLSLRPMNRFQILGDMDMGLLRGDPRLGELLKKAR